MPHNRGSSMSLTPLITAFSSERLERYIAWSNGDPALAIRLYTLNARFSEALYIPLQTLELALRNRVHAVMSEHYGEEWLLAESVCLRSLETQKIQRALEELNSSRKPLTPGRVVSALTFGFWTALMGKDYEDLWRKVLHRIASQPNGKRLARKNLSSRLHIIRTLRNRIAHHEPILFFNLPQHHKDMLQIIGWLSPEAEAWCAQNDRFPALYQQNTYQLAQAA